MQIRVNYSHERAEKYVNDLTKAKGKQIAGKRQLQTEKRRVM